MAIKEHLQLLTMLIPTLLLLAAVVVLVAFPAQSAERPPAGAIASISGGGDPEFDDRRLGGEARRELLGISSVQSAQDHLVFEFTPLAGDPVAEVGHVEAVVGDHPAQVGLGHDLVPGKAH
jgi:hypothetical protein